MTPRTLLALNARGLRQRRWIAAGYEARRQRHVRRDRITASRPRSRWSVSCSCSTPAFLYRVERAGELDGYEVSTRMAYLIWGSAPDDELLDDADDLDDAKHRVSQAERMLDDPRAQRNWERFAQWLGYSAASLPGPIAADLRGETGRLIECVVFEQDTDWLSIFRATETYITPALATHYGMPAISSPQWVKYPAGRGGGVLTHGPSLRCCGPSRTVKLIS